MDSSADTLILIHRIVGYPTAFIVAPAALLAFASPSVHRRWGMAYFYLIVFLYLTGTYLTLTRHEWSSWGFARNLAFNFFGFSMVLYAYRAIRLFRRPGAVQPERLDWFLAGLLTASVLGMLAVAVFKDTPMRIFTLIGIMLCGLEYRELRNGFRDKTVLFRRHLRYILGSYFYVLTVVSLVHLGDELPRKVKWLWPAVVGFTVIWLLTGQGGRRLGHALLFRPPGRIMRGLVWATVALSVMYGGYVVYDLAGGRTISSQDGGRLSGSAEPGRGAGIEPAAEHPADPPSQ